MDSVLPFVNVASRVHNETGFWGDVDAIHQFCEPHYQTTFYLAECWNALSSVWYIFLGYLVWKRHNNAQSWIVPVMAGWVIAVGIGSFLFHGTMRRSMQLLDEGPMMGYVGTSMIFKIGVHPYTKAHKVFFRTLAALLHAIVIGVYLWVGSYELFIHGFTLVVVFDVVLGATFSDGNLLYRDLTVVFILLARVFWELENYYCNDFPAVWPLHIVWHLLSGCSAYVGVVYLSSLVPVIDGLKED